MQVKLPSVNIASASETFHTWVNKTDGVINAVSNNCIVVIANSTGDSVDGNGTVNGTFGAITLFATTLRGGTVATPAAFTVSTNVTFSGTTSFGGGTITGNSVTTTGTSQQVIDQFALATFRGSKYVLSVNNNVSNAYSITEILVLHDGGNTFVTEYATLKSNGVIGTFDSDVTGANCRILFTPVPANTTVKFTAQRLGI